MKNLQPNGRETANILSFCTFWWMNSFFAKGAKQSLLEEDMLKLSEDDTSESVCKKLERNWNKELDKEKHGGEPSLGRAIVKTYGPRFLKIGLLTTIEETLHVVNPLLVVRLIQYFENMDTTPVSEAYILAALISVVSLFLAIFHHIYFYYVQRLGWHLRAAACALMYKKTLRLSQKSLGQITTGQIVNLGSTDVLRFDYLPLFLHYIWVGPLQAAVCGYLLWDAVGPAVLAGIGVLLALMIVQSVNGRAFGRLRMMTAIVSDERVRLMNEVITGMRIIKMYTWEKPFAELVAKIRKKEVHKVMLTAMLRAFNLSMFICAPKIIACVTFVVYVGMGGEISASQVFKVIGIYNVMRVSMGLFFPLAIEKMAESKISIQRIEAFLRRDEVKQVDRRDKINTNSLEKEKVVESGVKIEDGVIENTAPKKSFIEMKNYSGKWYSADENNDDSKNHLTLKNINVRVEAGQLLAVIGPVGAGKSSFLSAILGELPTTSGEIEINGKLTFANQVPWVFAGTVRENILFGQEYDKKWYDRVMQACGLERDLELLPNGDMTSVGERGVTLSGGQKARVNLARAAYRRDATICLLDDPLSAVDAAVGIHLFKHCVSGLMKDKTLILVTHQLQLLQDADQIIILKEGEVVGHGTYDELQADGTDFASLLQERDRPEEIKEALEDIEENETTVLIQSPRSPTSSNLKSPKFSTSNMSIKSDEVISLLGEEYMDIPKLGKDDDYIDQEPNEEMQARGSVNRHVYIEYFRVGAGKLFGLLFLLVTIASHVSFILCEWWISVWATRYEFFKQQSSNYTEVINSTAVTPANWTTSAPVTAITTLNSTVEESFDTNYYVIVYGVLTITAYVCIVIRATMHFYVCVSSGIHMHNKMFRAILRAPVRFFDTNPAGRILNRFSKDIGQIDDLLPLTFFDFLFICGLIVSILIVAIAINYFVAIIVVPLIGCFFWLRQYYLKTSRNIKRLEGSTRSPVFSLLSSTLQGLSTVRAFRAQNEFEEKFHERQDLHSSSWYLFLCAGRWLGVRLDLLSAAFITTIAFASLVTLSINSLEPGQVGLTLTYSLMLLGMFQWGVRQSTEVENLMTSVERVQQYYSLTPEAPDEVPEKTPPPEWPVHGVVTFDRVSFAYYDGGPEVLKKIRFNIRAQEKVGIVGRTGAGKSSLISALFRLSELTGGEILVDGIPISPLGLNDLRRSLSIIPQDPMLFTGTMRRNLDPFSQYTDEHLWGALKQVQLKGVVESLPLRLDTELAESGSNFSVGQRQLVCLARAILRRSKILVIDEATANVDLRTDRLIQLTIREKFKHCTVLTIAHRINTIIDSDRVMVIDAGCIAEFDEPYQLLQNPESSFSKMVDTTSANEAELLRRMAKALTGEWRSLLVDGLASQAHNARNEPNVALPDGFKDGDRSYLSRFLPTPGTYDLLEFETGL